MKQRFYGSGGQSTKSLKSKGRGGVIEQSVPAFRFEVKTAGVDTFQLPIYNGGTYDFNVDWGDENSDDITAYNDAAANHSYGRAGTYNVIITGTITGWRFADAGDKTLIYDISEWGPLNLGNNESYFSGCSNLTVSATDILDLTDTTTFKHAFYKCSLLETVPSMNSWDMSSVTNMDYMFRDCSVFNQDIGDWITSAVTNMDYMFNGASAFNQDITSWDVSSVIYFSVMFRSAVAFNQDIGSWDVSAAQFMSYMFHTATAFDQDIGGWNIALVTGMSFMFTDATLSSANYDALLIGWGGAGHDAQDNVTFAGGNSTYTSPGDAKDARDHLEAATPGGHGWTITDGGTA